MNLLKSYVLSDDVREEQKCKMFQILQVPFLHCVMFHTFFTNPKIVFFVYANDAVSLWGVLTKNKYIIGDMK